MTRTTSVKSLTISAPNLSRSIGGLTGWRRFQEKPPGIARGEKQRMKTAQITPGPDTAAAAPLRRGTRQQLPTRSTDSVH